MSELAAVWCDLVLLGSVQNLPVLAAAWLLDRLFVRLAWMQPRRVIWLLVVVELLAPPFIGSPFHIAFAPEGLLKPIVVPLEGAVRLDLPIFWLATWLGVGAMLALRSSWRLRISNRRLLNAARPACREVVAMARAASATLGMSTAPTVLVSHRADGPCVVGVLRPVVVLDCDVAPGEDLRHMLLHEIGHIQRRDPLRAWLWRWLLAGWWFHPSVWIAQRRFALLREVGCDALVTRSLGGYRPYCQTLADRALREAPTPSAGLGFVRLPAEVVQRVAALRESGRHSLRRLCAASVATLLLLFCCVPLRDEAGSGAVTAALPFGATSLSDIPGCLTQRYFVLSQLPLASSSQSTPTPPPTPHPR